MTIHQGDKARLTRAQEMLMRHTAPYEYQWVGGVTLRTARQLEQRGLARVEDDDYGAHKMFLTDAGHKALNP